MGNETAFYSAAWSAFMSWLNRSETISVPTDFRGRCSAIDRMLANDVTGLINTIIDYSINSASEARFKVKCTDSPSVEDLLNSWLKKVNININGIPSGLSALAKEYYKERWQQSSLILLRVQNWQDITVGDNTIRVPMTLFFVNGASIYVERDNEDKFKLGGDKYYLDKDLKFYLPHAKNERIVVQKPFGRWFTKYSTPYLVRKGVLKNFKAIEVLQSRGDDVITKIIPYIFAVKEGLPSEYKNGDNSSDSDFKAMEIDLQDKMQKYRQMRDKVPAWLTPNTINYEHVIPDIKNILTEELFRNGLRAILSGLGFVDVIQGISSTRKESVLNPAPFVAEVNAGVTDFKAILIDVINQIIEENKEEHIKLFSDKNSIKIVNSPLKINVEPILDQIRSAFDRGSLSHTSYIESLGFDKDEQVELRKTELDNGEEDLLYPHLIQNQEATPDRISPTKERNTQEDRKPGTPEAQTKFSAAIDLEIAPYKKNEDLPKYLQYLPDGAKTTFKDTFNNIYETTKDESKAFPIAYMQMNKWLRTNGYKKNSDGKWVKK
jgi:hypothetical protein